jgi:hypothetical protein
MTLIHPPCSHISVAVSSVTKVFRSGRNRQDKFWGSLDVVGLIKTGRRAHQDKLKGL